MSYPSLEQYQEALQNPSTALLDRELRVGSIQATGLGLPLALCGGFALTYTITSGGRKYAVRCFHKRADQLEQRYQAIAAALGVIKSSYFVKFQYQPQGVRVNGVTFPVVKMAWAEGETLGDFLERTHGDRQAMARLRMSLGQLCAFLESAQLAHGDIQPGNVMVSNSGGSLRLIDYDGMFVQALTGLGSSELGHRNFQHPRRSVRHYDSTLDRFSFIALDLALRALETNPSLWAATHSDSDSVLFKASDFSAPSASPLLAELSSRHGYSSDVQKFAAVCQSEFERVPRLADFLAGKSIPEGVVSIGQTTGGPRPRYAAAYPVLDANNYELCVSHVGDRVELVGRVHEVKPGRTRGGKPYLFVNFGPWQGEAVKLNLWSEGLAVVAKRPDQTWVGQWISVVGLMEPPYRSKRYRYSHVGISITQAHQIKFLSEEEARYRLNCGARTGSSQNVRVLAAIGRKPEMPPSAPPGPRHTPVSNRELLDRIKATTPAAKPLTVPHFQPAQASRGSSQGKGCAVWVIAAAIVMIYLLTKV